MIYAGKVASDSKHMEQFLRQEKHLCNAERETDRGVQEKQWRKEEEREKREKGRDIAEGGESFSAVRDVS